jgi:release factor glutamine methyltransferase
MFGTIQEALTASRLELSAFGSAYADGEILLSHVLGCDRSFLIAHPECELSAAQACEFEELAERRANGVPVAYLTGVAWFYGRPFVVNERVLVPRAETEHLVEAALEHLRNHENPVVLDVGTGSGAIACTIAAERPDAVVYAIDNDRVALGIARENARSLGVRVAFEDANLLPKGKPRFDAVVANLPYIPTGDLPRAPDPASFEPKQALDGGPDGLREYRRLLAILPPRVHPGAIVLLEAAPPTIHALEELAQNAFPHAKVTIGRDYAGLERYVAVLQQPEWPSLFSSPVAWPVRSGRASRQPRSAVF